jgi:hypothetical protein
MPRVQVYHAGIWVWPALKFRPKWGYGGIRCDGGLHMFETYAEFAERLATEAA